MRLNNKIALISGASAGIGRATARSLAAEGARLILTARRRERLEELAAELKNEFGTESFLIPLDVRVQSDVEKQIKNLPAEWRNIDILVNNAGLSRGLEPLQEGLIDNWEEMIDTNVKGLLYMSRAVMPGLLARNDGIIVNIGSIAGREVYPGGNVYCATKHAVKAISDGMRIDTNGSGVRVVNIDPGLVETEFAGVRFHGDQERARKVYEGYTPLRGEDVAEAVLFAVTRPKHVVIADMLIFPADQASSTIVNKTQS